MVTRRDVLAFIGLSTAAFIRGVVAASPQKAAKASKDKTVTLEISGMT